MILARALHEAIALAMTRAEEIAAAAAGELAARRRVAALVPVLFAARPGPALRALDGAIVAGHDAIGTIAACLGRARRTFLRRKAGADDEASR